MKLNKGTKKAKYFRERYECYYHNSLSDCYNSYSYAKAVAEVRCRDKMTSMNGWGFNIFSFNSMTFTCGWLYEDKETGITMLNVETAYNSYQMEF